jgi:serine protease
MSGRRSNRVRRSGLAAGVTAAVVAALLVGPAASAQQLASAGPVGLVGPAGLAASVADECAAAGELQSVVDRSAGVAGLAAQATDAARRRARILASIPDEAGCEGPVTVFVDDRLRPRSASLPALDRKTPRPLAALVDDEGSRTDFVADELVLTTSDEKQVTAFLERWGGVVLHRIEVRGGPAQYLVRIDSRRADPGRLSDHLETLNQGRTKAAALSVSSRSGLELLAAAAESATDKLTVGVNWLSEFESFENRTMLEATSGPAGHNTDPGTYGLNSYDWTYLNSGSVQDIGATEGWTLLDTVNRLDNKVRIGIVDAGFNPDVGGDLPQWTAISPFVWAGALDPGPSYAPWHGNDSASAAAAVPGNSRGGAGPAGPIARLSLVYTTPDYFLSMNAINVALFTGAKVISMSFGARVPWPLAWTVLPFDGYTAFIRTFNDILLFAAAGNDGESVDKTTCVWFVCWEKHWHTPCENAGVRCVGGLATNSLNRDGFSNFGHEDVDFFAPFWVLVGATPQFPSLLSAREVGGTSVATPYAAGVAALVWAANPGLSADSIDAILRNHRRPSPDANVHNRVIHAFGAVQDALPPVIAIKAPSDGANLSAVLPTEFRATVFDDGHGSPTVTWRRNGVVFGTGTTVLALPPPGTHTIRATATFPDGASATDVITVHVVNHTPTVHINAPRNPDNSPVVFGQSELIPFHATSQDDAGPLPENRLTWHLDGAAASFATGHNPTVNTGAAIGPHTVTLRGCDTFNVCATDTVPILIQANPSNQPPTVHITNPTNGSILWVNGSDASGWYHEITLTGTATDPEGGPLTRVWLDNNVQIATTASPTVRLRGGCEGGHAHRITLRVTDSAGNTRQDEVDVTVSLIC